MHSYNTKIIKSEEATKKVTDYNAKKITHETPKRVHPSNEFQAEYTGHAGSFRMDELLKERTGIGEKRQKEIMDEVEITVIDRLKKVEEDAYQKAYELGREEGTEEGLQKAEGLVAQKIESLDQIMSQLNDLRKQMIIENEAAIVSLCYQLASKIALRNISEDPGYIMDAIENLIDSMQSDTNINLKVSNEDFDFIEQFKDRDLKTKDMFAKLKVYRENDLQHGECILESNHGVVNASMEERISKLWQSLSENLPKSELENTILEAKSETSSFGESVVSEEIAADTKEEVRQENSIEEPEGNDDQE